MPGWMKAALAVIGAFLIRDAANAAAYTQPRAGAVSAARHLPILPKRQPDELMASRWMLPDTPSLSSDRPATTFKWTGRTVKMRMRLPGWWDAHPPPPHERRRHGRVTTPTPD